jgi:hypothetical protein
MFTLFAIRLRPIWCIVSFFILRSVFVKAVLVRLEGVSTVDHCVTTNLQFYFRAGGLTLPDPISNCQMSRLSGLLCEL